MKRGVCCNQAITCSVLGYSNDHTGSIHIFYCFSLFCLLQSHGLFNATFYYTLQVLRTIGNSGGTLYMYILLSCGTPYTKPGAYEPPSYKVRVAPFGGS